MSLPAPSFGATIAAVGKTIFHFFREIGCCGPPTETQECPHALQPLEDRPSARQGAKPYWQEKELPKIPRQETGLPASDASVIYYGSPVGTYQYEQQRSTGRTNLSVRRPSPTLATPPTRSASAPGYTINSTYSTAAPSIAGPSSRYTPYSYSAAAQTSHSKYDPHSGLGDEALADVSNLNIHAYTRVQPLVERRGDGSNVLPGQRLYGEEPYIETLSQTERNKLVPEPRITYPPTAHRYRDARFEQRDIQNRYKKQTTPPKSKEELEEMIRIEVASTDSRFKIRGEDEVGFENRNAALELRSRRDAAATLKVTAFRERRIEDGKQLLSILKGLSAEMEHFNALAANEIYAHHNRTRFNSESNEIASHRCDVHGLYIAEAQNFVKHFLDASVEKALRDVRIITGKGIHSQGGQAKLRPAILKFLKGRIDIEECKIDESNAGCILVRLKLNQSKTP